MDSKQKNRWSRGYCIFLLRYAGCFAAFVRSGLIVSGDAASNSTDIPTGLTGAQSLRQPARAQSRRAVSKVVTWGACIPVVGHPRWSAHPVRQRLHVNVTELRVTVRTLTVSPLVGCVRMLHLEQLTDLDLALGAVLAGVDPGKRLERHTVGPFDGLVHRLHLEDPVARDQLLRLGERPVDDGAVPPGELDTPPPGARVKPCEVEEHSGLLELVVVPAHRGEEFLAGRCARFRIPLDHQHHPHVLLPSCPGRAPDGLDRV